MKKITLLVTFLLAVSAVCFADIIHVPGDQPTIQTGIGAAVNGDTVLVAPGTYVENIDFMGKAITVASSHGAEETVIKNVALLASVVSFVNEESNDSVLEGFGLTCGTGTPFELFQDSWYYCGGGIFCLDSSPTISECLIFDNAVDGGGGGIFCYQASPIIEGNGIHNNTAAKGGCGIYSKGTSSPTITNNMIRGNGLGHSDGGGIQCCWFSCPTITDNIITGNSSWSGGGINCEYDTAATITGNIISLNDATHGGGIRSWDCIRLTVTDNLIMENSGTQGGGVYGYGDGKITIENNNIQKNIGMSGGGVYMSKTSVAWIINNIIKENHASGGGGGINCSEGLVRIYDNTIQNNTCSAYGGGVYCYSCSPYMLNNIIGENSADSKGGGIYCASKARPSITNNTIVNNSAPEGGGICCRSTNRDSEVVNTILWGNEAQSGPEIALLGDSYHSTITISYSDIEGGLSSVYIKQGSVLNWGEGMIDVDPQFVCNRANIIGKETENDYHLSYLSPCLLAGDDNANLLPDEDFEGDPRVVGGNVGLGADEFYYHLYCMGDFTPNGDIVVKIVGAPETPAGLFIGSGVMDPPIQHKWGDFYLESPWFFIPLVPIPSNGVLQIPARLPSTPAPYDIPMQALNEWQLTNLFVLKVR